MFFTEYLHGITQKNYITLFKCNIQQPLYVYIKEKRLLYTAFKQCAVIILSGITAMWISLYTVHEVIIPQASTFRS